MTGDMVTRPNPMTWEPRPWTWKRQYGCNYPIASEYVLTFRSGAAGFYDLANDGGTGNFGGFKSSCTSNLVAADGVLNAPDYTRTCSCSYQNQTSLAFVHDPDVEVWTFNNYESDPDATIRQAGLNFGAPGDRRVPDGTLWLDYPSVGGPSPDIPVTVEPENVQYFLHHASWIQNGSMKWVAASGVKGASVITITTAPEGAPPRSHTVRLYFVEPDGLGPGERLLNVALQGTEVLGDFDIADEAGGPARAYMVECKGVSVAGELTVELTPSASSKVDETVLCGVEVLVEE